ncbi:hypothetical protein OY671_011721, partial [Metschnikowia pulcherrima]
RGTLDRRTRHRSRGSGHHPPAHGGVPTGSRQWRGGADHARRRLSSGGGGQGRVRNGPSAGGARLHRLCPVLSPARRRSGLRAGRAAGRRAARHAPDPPPRALFRDRSGARLRHGFFRRRPRLRQPVHALCRYRLCAGRRRRRAFRAPALGRAALSRDFH